MRDDRDQFLKKGLQSRKKDCFMASLGYLAGDGTLREPIEDKIRREEINVKYVGSLDSKACQQLLKRMHIGIAPSTNDLARLAAWPVKVMEYASFGLAVVSRNVGDWGEVLSSHKCGVCVKNGTAMEYYEAIKYLSESSTWADASTCALRMIQDQYSWDKLMAKMEFLGSLRIPKSLEVLKDIG